MKKSLFIITVVGIALLLAQSMFAQEIFDAVRNGDLAKVKELIEKDPQLVKARNANQSTPLHVAVDVNNESIAGYLIEKGAGVNAVNVIGWTPLFYAQNVKIARVLVEKGADVNFNRNGASYSDALRVALVDRRKDVAEYLIEKGAALPEIGSVWGADLLIQSLKSGSIK